VSRRLPVFAHRLPDASVGPKIWDMPNNWWRQRVSPEDIPPGIYFNWMATLVFAAFVAGVVAVRWAAALGIIAVATGPFFAWRRSLSARGE
jgi:hypothetical protein